MTMPWVPQRGRKKVNPNRMKNSPRRTNNHQGCDASLRLERGASPYLQCEKKKRATKNPERGKPDQRRRGKSNPKERCGKGQSGRKVPFQVTRNKVEDIDFWQKWVECRNN